MSIGAGHVADGHPPLRDKGGADEKGARDLIDRKDWPEDARNAQAAFDEASWDAVEH